MRWTGIVLVTMCFSSLAAQETKEELQEYFTKAFAQRRVVLEKVHNVAFDTDWIPSVTIGLPDYAQGNDYWAIYEPSTQKFFISRHTNRFATAKMLQEADFASSTPVHYSSSQSNRVVMMVDHELGHALADQICWRLHKKQFPPDYSTLFSRDRLGYQVVSEGIGSWFEKTSVHGYVPAEAFPASTDFFSLNRFEDSLKLYHSGLWLVGPILDNNAQAGLEYLITHPFRPHADDIITAAYDYRSELFRHMPAERQYEQAVKALMRQLENDMALVFWAPPPVVAFAETERKSWDRQNIAAQYDFRTNTLVVHPRYKNADVQHLVYWPSAKKRPRDLPKETAEIRFVREILAHELGRFYIDTLIEKDYPESWLLADWNSDAHGNTECRAGLVVTEGIARCFAEAVVTKASYFPVEPWSDDVVSPIISFPAQLHYYSYLGGYQLVKPMVQPHRDLAIRYFVQNRLELDYPKFEKVYEYRKDLATAFGK